eukprot:CAMPEP_0115005946 /NCGR_PEP_ID=MMETSP0216-20121206/20191_1 /TAXON_ID=223996 /ORGANISM="Protocruzia adherens, Strain Boccale" /LENGTH=272 /DNA_ID=CAMNT_0002372403 /DNA_START=544 /DNA_END=1362 /DNA_ORIENTATION=+
MKGLVLLPMNFLKWFNVVLSALSIIAGIVLASVSGANSGDEGLELFDLYSLVMDSYLAFGIIYIIVGIIGLVGAFKPNMILGIVFSALIVMASIAFLSVGVAILTDWESEKTDFEDSGCKLDTYKNYENTVSLGKQWLCKSECPCEFLPDWLQSQTGLSTTLNNGATKVQDCPKYATSFSNKSDVSYLKYLEEEFDCAGFCTHPGYKLFSKLSNQPGSTPCLQYVLNDMEEVAKDYGYGAIIVGLTFVLSSSLACCFVGAIKRFDYKPPTTA